VARICKDADAHSLELLIIKRDFKASLAGLRSGFPNAPRSFREEHPLMAFKPKASQLTECCGWSVSEISFEEKDGVAANRAE
jgi:hypothetical protein